MGSGNMPSVSGFMGPQGKDLRQPFVSHFRQAFGGALDDDTAKIMIERLAQQRENPDPAQIKQILEDALGQSLDEVGEAAEDALELVLRRMLRQPGAGSEVAWLPLEALVKKTDGFVGFKGPPELDARFQRWKDDKTKLGVDIEELTPENFITDMRLDIGTKRSPNGIPIGFENPTANQAYRRWVRDQKRRQLGNDNINISDLDDPGAFEEFPATLYMHHVAPDRRPLATLEALFGPNALRHTGRGNSAPCPDQSNWGKVFKRTFKEAEETWKQNVIDIVADRRVFAQRMREAFARRFPDGAPTNPDNIELWDEEISLWVYQSIVHHIDEAGGNLTAQLGDKVFYNHFIRAQLEGEIGDDILKAMLGPSIMRNGIHSEEFIERLLDCYVTFGATGINMGIPWSHAAYARVGGMFELIQKGMSRSGTVRGYTFELEVIFTSIKKHLHEGADDVDILLQFDINDLPGPDIMLVTANKVSVQQAKAYKTMSGLYHLNGEVARQTGSDIRRFMDAYMDDLDALADGTGPIDWPTIPIEGHGDRQLDNVWTFFIDGRRTEGGLSAVVERNVRDTAQQMNDLIKNTAVATDDNIADILAKSTEKLVKDGTETLASKINLARSTANPPLTVGQVALMRMMMQEHMGELSDEALERLVKQARVASRLNPPIEIVMDVRTKQHLNAGSFDSPFEAFSTAEN